MHCDCFENLIFVDDKLIAKTANITSLKNLYAYGTSHKTYKMHNLQELTLD